MHRPHNKCLKCRSVVISSLEDSTAYSKGHRLGVFYLCTSSSLRNTLNSNTLPRCLQRLYLSISSSINTSSRLSINNYLIRSNNNLALYRITEILVSTKRLHRIYRSLL